MNIKEMDNFELTEVIFQRLVKNHKDIININSNLIFNTLLNLLDEIRSTDEFRTIPKRSS